MVDVMDTAYTAFEQGKKLLHGYKSCMDAKLCSSTLVEALHIYWNHMTAWGSDMLDIAKWKMLLYYMENELMKMKIVAGFSDEKTPATEKCQGDWLDMNETQQEEMKGMRIHIFDLCTVWYGEFDHS